jgi:protein phosphatase
MQDLLARTTELEKACSQLIDLANAAGGNDNVTCVLARFHAN